VVLTGEKVGIEIIGLSANSYNKNLPLLGV